MPKASRTAQTLAGIASPDDIFAYGEGIPKNATWRNLLPAAELGLSMAPVSGEAISARDAWRASGAGELALREGRFADAAGDYSNLALSLAGSIPGAGIIARGTKRGAAWMDRNLPQGFNRLLDAMTPKASQDTMYSIPAWHGSPHDFDEFKLDKIGTGEGAQAYGHGLYFAENRGVAREYEGALAKSGNDPAVMAREALYEAGGDHQKALEALRKQQEGLDSVAATMRYSGDPTFGWSADSGREAMQLLEKHSLGEKLPLPGKGRLYKTELDVEPEDLLDWDKPLSEQSEKIRTAVKSLFTKENGLGHVQDIDHLPGENILQLLRMGKAGPDKAAGVLREAGIPGIRYLDQGSRGGEGTRNFVIFDDSLVKILGKE